MNQVKSSSADAPRTSLGKHIGTGAAILLLQVNLAWPSALAQQDQAAPISPAPQPVAQKAPEPIPFGQLAHPSLNPLDAYRGEIVPPPNMINSIRLNSLVRDGKLHLSLRDAIDLALENNLDIVIARYNLPIALADIQRTKAGGVVRGVNTGVVTGTPGGAPSGTGGGAGAGGTSSGAGGAGAGASGLVQSTSGLGTAVSSYDPFITAQAFVDHTSTELANFQQEGVPVYKVNSAQANVSYFQAFQEGGSLELDLSNYRQTSNGIYDFFVPEYFTRARVLLQQQLLAGFGFGPNLRYLRIARTNRKETDIAFKAQVIATVDQIANIYWDLVAAYEDEQVQERSVSFATETLDMSRKQLALQAIAEMDVLKAEGDLAQRQQDLAVSKSNLELQELYMKNAITRSLDDPILAEMPIVPTDRIGGEIKPDDEPLQQAIDGALKNRTDLQIQGLVLETSELSRKTTRNALLPQLTAYAFYTGTGTAGVVNRNYKGGSATTTLGTDYGSAFDSAFNNSAPEYQVGFQLSLPLRNRVAKADQYRSELEYRQSQVSLEEYKKRIVIEVRSARYALDQGASRVQAARTARDLAQKTLDINKQEQKLGAGSNQQTLASDRDLAVAESALVAAETDYEKKRIEVKRAVGTLLEDYNISIADAKALSVEEASHP